ncbi:MAG TPA: dihydroorotase [Ferruginibacter sp.]|nr:dihydroorotase [Ferruginibacter sp.]
MKVLIKQATIVNSTSPFNGHVKDIYIKDGIIITIADTITEKADKIIEAKNLSISIGWIDVFSHFCDPGYEHRETLETGAKAAAAGGFTEVMVMPNTNPVIHSKSQVEYIIQKSKDLSVTIHPIGAITKNTEGKELAEMYDMQQSGAIAFSDGNNSIQQPGILLKALQYVLAFDGTVIQLPDDKSISPHGLMNEGIVSTQLGLPGKPAIAEELMIARDIELVKYTGSKIHFTGVSTKKSIELITKAKADGLKITCSVTPYHVFFCDEDLSTYDTNLKVNPPLRTKEDMLALREAIKKGTIDCFSSHHIPQNADSKICEFEYAKNGMVGLETLFGSILSITDNPSLVVEQLTIAPRKIFGLPIPEIKEGAIANLTLFDTTTEFTVEESMIKSKSKNSAFVGKKLKGKVIGILHGGKLELN